MNNGFFPPRRAAKPTIYAYEYSRRATSAEEEVLNEKITKD